MSKREKRQGDQGGQPQPQQWPGKQGGQPGQQWPGKPGNQPERVCTMIVAQTVEEPEEHIHPLKMLLPRMKLGASLEPVFERLFGDGGTPEERARLRSDLLDYAANDQRVSGAAITGSAAGGREGSRESPNALVL